MKLTRLICLIVSLALVASLFAGCGKKEDDEYSTIVTYEEVSTEGTASEKEETDKDDKDGKDDKDNSDKDTNSNKDNGGSDKDNGKDNDSDKDDGEVLDLGGRTITYRTFWAEPKKGGSDFDNTYWKKKTEVEKKYNCKFKFVHGSDDTFYDTVITSIVAGKPNCDVMTSKTVAFSAMKEGLFYDLSKLKSIDLNDDKWYDHVTKMGTLNGKKYLMQAGKFSHNNMILYNKDLFAAEKAPDLYTLQKSGKLTLDKLVSIMKDMSTTKKASTVVDIFPFNLHIQFAYAYGGKLVTRTDGTTNFKSAMKNTAVSTGFKKAQDLLNTGIVVNDAGSSWEWARDEFLKGNYPIMIGSGDLQKIGSNCNFDLGACVMPTVNGGKVSVISDVQWDAIPYNAKKPEEIAAVYNEMVEAIFEVNYKVRYQDILPADAMAVIDDMSARQVKGQLDVDYHNAIEIWKDGVGGVFNNMIAGSITPATAITTVNNQITAKLNKLR